MADPTIRAYANCDDAYVVWRYDKPVPGCRGFALHRKPDGKPQEPVQTFVPFAGQRHDPGEHRPSTEWPIQRYSWTDVLARNGDLIQYRVVPMIGKAGDLTEDTAHATAWTEPLEVTAKASDELYAYFNRGVLATQSIARRLDATKPWQKQLTTMINTPGDPTRDYLSGELRLALRDQLARVKAAPDAVLHAALFELDDPELINDLCALGQRARIVLANGADAQGDENKDARDQLQAAGVEVHDRMTGGRLAHNKFLIACDPEDTPLRVWTGSTNWSVRGLCTQVNNGLLIDNKDVARYYLEHWKALRDAGNAFPGSLLAGDGEKKTATLNPGAAGTWFTPVHKQVDLVDARAMIAAASQGILFLMFNPGRADSLLNAILDRADADPHLYVHGVLNQDPEAGAKDPALVGLIHRNKLDEADPDIVLPSKVDERFAGWAQEINHYSLVMVHSKVIVLDPFGPTPIVMTGSHNLGTRASSQNDDNLTIITGVPKLAAAYATNVRAIYDVYRWRYVRSDKAKRVGDDWSGPEDNDAWQDFYFTGPDAPAKQRELSFWLGEA
jgi:phosphatidylserine/phosphatidylglycerophosphate/cardiolipin synthase-like enzyme